MNLAFLYAYLENISAVGTWGWAVLTIGIAALVFFRCINAIDKDDWILLMYWSIPLWLFFGILMSMPDVEHIKKAKLTLSDIETFPTKESVNETINESVVPTSATCDTIGVCASKSLPQ